MTTRAKIWIGLGVTALAVAGALAACGEVKRPDGGVGLLPVGAPAPDVQGVDGNGKLVHLTDTRGRYAVVYFYPKDGTPGCTTEACAFRDAFARYEAAHVTIFGVSRDTAETHQDFQKNHKLLFPLVSDDGHVSDAYGVSSTLGMDSRVTFLVGPDGKVAHVWPKVDPGVHANDVLAAVTPTTP